MIVTPCGLIGYEEARTGTPLLAVHVSGGGFDQGMVFVAPPASRHFRVIAMSRFCYLRTMPADASVEAHADAFVCDSDAVLAAIATLVTSTRRAPMSLGRILAIALILIPLGGLSGRFADYGYSSVDVLMLIGGT